MPTPEEMVLEKLKELDVSFEPHEIDPQLADTNVYCETFDWPLSQSCNFILVKTRKGERKYAACGVLATTKLDVNRKVKELLGAKSSFASGEEMKEVTGMEIGGVTPFSLPKDMPMYVDSRVMECDRIILGGGGRSLKIKVGPDVLKQLGAEIIEDLALA